METGADRAYEEFESRSITDKALGRSKTAAKTKRHAALTSFWKRFDSSINAVKYSELIKGYFALPCDDPNDEFSKKTTEDILDLLTQLGTSKTKQELAVLINNKKREKLLSTTVGYGLSTDELTFLQYGR